MFAAFTRRPRPSSHLISAEDAGNGEFRVQCLKLDYLQAVTHDSIIPTIISGCLPLLVPLRQCQIIVARNSYVDGNT